MAKAKAKNKKSAVKAKASKPAKAKKSKAPVKKASKPAKKAAPKKAAKKVAKPAKKVAKPVAKKKAPAPKKAAPKKAAKPVAPKAKAKVATPKKAPVANNKTKVVNKAEEKKVSKPVAETKANDNTVKPLKRISNKEKRVIREELKPEPKHFYKTPTAAPFTAPQKQEPIKTKKMTPDLNLRYSDDELKEFKELIDKKLAAAREELHNLKETLDNHTESQAGNKAWNMEEGTDTSEMEYLMNQISRQHQYIRNLELALVRIENKTYGICRVTGKLIPKERLRVVPHATLSLEAKNNRKTDTEEAPAAGSAPPSDFAEGFED